MANAPTPQFIKLENFTLFSFFIIPQEEPEYEYYYEYYYDYEDEEDDSAPSPNRPVLKSIDDYDLNPILNKVRILPNGKTECLDVGVFPHPHSCRKFVTCSRRAARQVRKKNV